MENQIANSTLKLAGSQVSNGYIFLDANSIILLLIFVALLLVALSLFGFVKYKRDKDNVPDGTTVDNLKKEVKFYSSDFNAINQRLNALEEKQEGIDALHKSILELKNIIVQGGNKDE